MREYPYPIVLWLTNPLLTELSRKAPDFWSWRKDVFRFQMMPSVQNVFGGQDFQNNDWNAQVTQAGDNVNIYFSVPPERDLLSSADKRPLLPETLEDDSIPLKDLQQLINQTEQKQANNLDDPLLATLYSRMGQAYVSQVKLGEIEASQTTIEQAIEWFQKAARVQEALGIIVDLAKNLSWLGYLYELQGQYVEAEPLLRQALKIFEQQLGSDHPSVATTLHNLSVSYLLQGRYAEARSLLQQKSLNIPNNLPYRGTPLFIGRKAE